MIRRSFALMVAGTIFLTGCKSESSVHGNTVAPSPADAQEGITVEVFEAVLETAPHIIPFVGTLYSAEDAVISTRTAGILRRTHVDVGAVVEPGDPLAQVDTSDYEVNVKQAQAALAEALARLGVESPPDESFDLHNVSAVRRAAAQLENARFNYERLKTVGASGQMVASQELNDAATRLRVAEADHRLAVDEAAALVATSRERQAMLQLASQRLTNTTTRTPPIPTTLGREGAQRWIVAERLVTEGQYLNVADPLYRLIVNDPLKLRSKVPERYAGQVRLGQQVGIEVAGAAIPPKGEIVRVSPMVDPASRMFEIEALIDNPEDRVKPGAFAKGTIAIDGAPTIFVPEQSVVTAGGEARVFVVENGTARARSVRIGRQLQHRIEILSGISEGDEVISHGLAGLSDGAVVLRKKGT